MNILQIVIIALIVAIVFGSGFLFVKNQEAERKKRAMKVIKGRAAKKEKASDKDSQDRRRAEIAKKLKDSVDEEKKGKKKATISMLIERAGLNISQQKYWILSFVSAVLFVLLAKIFGQPLFVVLMAFIIGLLGFPRFVLKFLAKRRQKKFLEEFPDALEATVRLLKAGMPVSEAISMISREYTGPVGEEMSHIYDKQKIGIPLAEAAYEATRRMPIAEMQMFATGLAIQAQTGSSLSEVLLNLSSVIRARFRLKRKVKALSSEAIASAGIIGALPNLVAFGMYFANREYIMILFTEPVGKVLLTCAVVWMMIGIFVMRAMINFKV